MTKIKIGTIDVVQFGENDLGDSSEFSARYVAWFETSMISTCTPLFDDCDSNYDVRDRLKAAHVLTKACFDDCESCALVVNFKRKDTARSFLKRLNKYLQEKARKLEEAREF